MILGLFQRHFKIYSGANFIPFQAESPSNLTTFIGNNGNGKSSILEALDTYFNNKDFNINLNGKKSEAFVSPLLLLNQEQLNKFSPDSRKIIEVVSDFLWDEPITKTTNYNPYKDFFHYRDLKIQSLKSSHYIFTLAKDFDNSERYFLTFTSAIQKRLTSDIGQELNKKTYLLLLSELNKLFAYIYIPVEASIEEFLKLETSGMQSLIDKKVADAINETLTKKQIKEGTAGKGRAKTVSLLDILNSNLESYIDEIEKKIKAIDMSYDFKMDFRAKQKLTANDLKEQIIYAYVSRRNLRKDDKPIKNLSAGERKKALVDVAYSLISGNTKRDKFILFAIDEPESSLHISNCFSQFERIEEISKSEKCQVLMTTHWYGSLPILNHGTLVHLDLDKVGQPTFNKFSFRNYFEERGSHPDDVQLKSFYDLTTSIISSIRHYETNWLIVEGTDDFNYLNKNISIPNGKILPVGGCSIVKLLYDFLFVPLSHKTESKDMKGKIFCLIDTDNEKGMELQHPPQTKSGNLILRRLQVKNNSVELVKEDDYNRLPTEVEDSLHSNDLFCSILNVATEINNINLLSTLKDFSIDSTVNHSMISGDNSMLIYSGLATDLKKEKQEIMSFIEKNKEKISLAYSQLLKVKKPTWMTEVEAFFKKE